MTSLARTVVVLLILSVLVLPGCVGLGALGFGATGVQALGEDAAELLVVEHSFDAVYAAALKEVESRGTLRYTEARIGKIDAEILGSRVEVRITGPKRGTVRCVVSARRNIGISPDQRLASDLASSIEDRLDG